MEKSYQMDKVAIKLAYFCNQKKEIYFKRRDVTEYLISESPFSIPNKQGFDGNLSYFGYDISLDADNHRILALRGKKLNQACLSGVINFHIEGDSVVLSVPDALKEIFTEIDLLIANKANESRAFNSKRRIAMKLGLEECDFRVFGNQKIYEKESKYYIFPKLVIDPISGSHAYEIVNSPKYLEYNPFIIFPIYNEAYREQREVIYRYERFFYTDSLGSGSNDFYYFILKDDEPLIVDIGSFSLETVINAVSNTDYSLVDRETSRKVLTNTRLNTGVLRKLAIARDGGRCRLCSIDNQEILICSHIKPWRDGDARLDLNNVLTLCAIHDKLFDRGLISFSKAGTVLISEELNTENEMMRSVLRQTENLTFKNDEAQVKEFIRYHREYVFRY